MQTVKWIRHELPKHYVSVNICAIIYITTCTRSARQLHKELISSYVRECFYVIMSLVLCDIIYKIFPSDMESHNKQ